MFRSPCTEKCCDSVQRPNFTLRHFYFQKDKYFPRVPLLSFRGVL